MISLTEMKLESNSKIRIDFNIFFCCEAIDRIADSE